MWSRKEARIGDFLRRNDAESVKAVKINSSDLRSTFRSRVNESNLKRILLWSTFYCRKGQDAYCLSKKLLQRQKEICNYQCEFTSNKSLIASSHAVVFNKRDLQRATANVASKCSTTMPDAKSRLSSQPWVLLMLESPVHSWTDASHVDNIFNWTMTYRTDSDIYVPYGKVETLIRENWSEHGNKMNDNKTKLVAWINSNKRSQPSKRNELVPQLKKYIQIDIYGRGRLKCSKNNSNLCENLLGCYEKIGWKYKFYLAFENSLCEDYITEKAFHALRTGMVPIVYGHANYANYLPNNSYINAIDFESVEDLGKYLVHLDKNPQEYLKYFEWKKSQVVVPDTFFLERAWCSLCEKVSRGNEAHNQPSVVHKLKDWWNNRNGTSVCVSPTKFHL